MRKLGFSEKWIYLVNQCISIVSYSILLNGYPSAPSQGDPLSPYLFVICAKGFSALLQRTNNLNDIYGMRLCRAALSYHTCFLWMIPLFFQKVQTGTVIVF